MEQAVRRLLERIPLNPHEVRTALRQMSIENAREYYRAAARILAGMPEDETPGRFLATQLIKDSQLWDVVSDADLMEPAPMANLLRRLVKTDPGLDDRLITDTLAAAVGRQDPALERRVGHALEVLTDLGGERMLPWLMRLLRHGSPHIRSKAALLIGRTNRNAAWARLLLFEKDARVRANAVQAMWKSGSPGCEDLFRKAAADRDNRVAGNGIVGLYHSGDPRSVETLRAMAEHPEESFRGTAAWAMGNTDDPRFLGLLAEMIRDEAALVRRNALRARARILRVLAERRALDGLRCRLLKSESAENGLRLLRVGVSCRTGEPLPATGFAIEEAGCPVWEYALTGAPATGHAAVAFVLPRGADGVEEALEGERQRKPAADSWTFQHYEPGQESVPPHALAALEQVLDTVAEQPASRSVVVLVDQDDTSRTAKAGDAVGAAALEREIRIHGVRVDGAVVGWLDRASSVTGGVTEICGREDLAGALERVLSAAGQVYELSYVLPGPGDGKTVRVQAHSDEGASEDESTLSTLIPREESAFALD